MILFSYRDIHQLGGKCHVMPICRSSRPIMLSPLSLSLFHAHPILTVPVARPPPFFNVLATMFVLVWSDLVCSGPSSCRGWASRPNVGPLGGKCHVTPICRPAKQPADSVWSANRQRQWQQSIAGLRGVAPNSAGGSFSGHSHSYTSSIFRRHGTEGSP